MAWQSGNMLVSISIVGLCRVQLTLEWFTHLRVGKLSRYIGYNYLG